jgi:hypothetical protein
MTFAELKAQFNAILNRTDITTALTETFISQAMSRAQRELRLPAQERELTVTVTEPFTGITVPTDFLQSISVTANDFYVGYTPRAAFLELPQGAQGIPLTYTRLGNKFVYKPTPVADTVITHYYYGEFTPFTTEDSTSTISLVAPDLIIYGALSYASDYYLDERKVDFEARYQQISQALQDQAYDADGPGEVQPTAFFDDGVP